MRYRIEKSIPTRYGSFVMYGGIYRWLWAARIAKWCAELLPDLRRYICVSIGTIPEDGSVANE